MEKRHAYFSSELKVRAETDSEKYIEGYFAVFEQETELWERCFEKIARGAFDNSIKNNDIRCLFNHDSGFVLGRTASGTLELRTDVRGLWGRVKINPSDTSALDVYARVERGDISGCSFGFNVPFNGEECIDRGDNYLWIVREADTHEVSICTFPAYEQTEIQARQKDFEQSKKRSIEQTKSELKKRLEGLNC